MALAERSASREESGVERNRRQGLGVVLAYLSLIAGLAGVAGWLLVQDGTAGAERSGDPPRVEVAIERAASTPAPPAAPRPVAPPPPAPVSPPAPEPPRAAVSPGGDGKVMLAAAPAPGLVEDTPAGPLPRVGRDGRQPWQVYARPFELSDRRPRVAVLISELGLSSMLTEASIERLPGAVSLGFVPYAERLPSWTEQARAAGHEVLLTLPMEPLSYPRDDPGPQTLLTSLSDRENLQRVEWVMSRVVGHVGMVSFMGSRFTTNPVTLRPVLTAMKSRGLLYVDNQPGVNSLAPGIARDIGLPHGVADRFIDDVATRAAIDEQLAALETLARDKGSALGVGLPYPVTLDRIAQWAPTLAAKGLALAPVSAVVKRP